MKHHGKERTRRQGEGRQTKEVRLWQMALMVALSVCITGASWSPASISMAAGGQAGKNLAPGKETRLHQDLLSVAFPSAKEGWATGRWGTIIHTSDGGALWENQVSGTDYTLASASFVDAKTGWIVGDGGTILHTRNGGKTWGKQKSTVPFYLMGVHFATPQKGWVVGERTTILNTIDGGKTWRVQFQDEDFILKSISFCDERNGWAVGEYGLIFHTEDGGASWKKQAGGFGICEETGELEAGNILFKVVAVNPQTAWAVGIDGFITKTVDGGTTWQPVGKDVPKVHLFGLAHGVDKVVIGGIGLLLVGSSNGNTYKVAQAVPKVTYGYIYSIAPRGKEGFVAVGKGGWIYLTDEKASQWRLAEKR